MKKRKLVLAAIGILAVSMLSLFTVACEDTLLGPETEGLGREVLDADQAAADVEHHMHQHCGHQARCLLTIVPGQEAQDDCEKQEHQLRRDTSRCAHGR